MPDPKTPPPRPARPGRTAACLALCLLSLAGCNPQIASRDDPTPAPIAVDWAAIGETTDLGGGWQVRRCAAPVVALCVDRNGTPAGHILMEDLPTLGEENTKSPDHVQAMLAVRTHTIYLFLRRHRMEACGENYVVDTAVPRPVAVAGGTGLRYEATGSVDSVVVERTIGYRTLRGNVETLIEATAIRPGNCLTPEDPTFGVEDLREFEGLLDRMVAGSDLPEATAFAELPPALGGSQDPRVVRAPTNGLGISHGLGSNP